MKRGESYLAEIPYYESWHHVVNRFGAVSVGSKIIIVGGWGAQTEGWCGYIRHSSSDKIRVIDFNGVENYEEAKNKIWKVVGRLKTAIRDATIQVINNKLWIEGTRSKTSKNHPIQVCEMRDPPWMWTCTRHDNLLVSSSKTRGLHFPISFQRSNNKLIYVGGAVSETLYYRIVSLHEPPTATYVEMDKDGFNGMDGVSHMFTFTNIQL